MRKKPIFRVVCAVVAWIFCSATVQAGQVVTQKERAWAKKASSISESERELAPVSDTNSVAVLYFKNTTGLDDLNPLQKGMALMLITDLSKVKRIQVVERIKMQALLEEMRLGASGLVDQGTAPKVGRILGAYYVSTGDIALGKMVKLDINPVLIDVPFETVTPQAATSGNMEDIFQMEKRILFNIIKQMKIFLTASEKKELAKPLTISTVAAMAFFTGVDLSDKGSYIEAAKFYNKALLEDKNFALAKDALQELKGLGLVNAEQAAPQSTAAKAAVEEGSSTGTVTLLAVGALAAGGAAFALGGGGSSSTPSSPNTDTNTDTSKPTIVDSSPKDGAALEGCSSGQVIYTFSELISHCDTVEITSDGNLTDRWSNVGQSVDDDTLTVDYQMKDYTGSDTTCGVTNTYTMRTLVSGCQDAQGNVMDDARFSYTSQ